MSDGSDREREEDGEPRAKARSAAEREDAGQEHRDRAAGRSGEEDVPDEGKPVADEILVESDRAFTDLTRPTRRHRTAAFFGMLGVALAAFATGLVLFDNVLMPRLIHGVAEVRVPDLTNLSLEESEKLLSAVGLRLTRAGERLDAAVPRGLILAQDPPADTPVRGHRRVSVVISLGEEFSSVPELFGETMRGARVLLERGGLRASGITRAPSDQVGEGLVVSTDPPAETVLPRNTPVSLLISTGAGEESFVIPDLVGRDLAVARRELEAMGFRVLSRSNASGGAIFGQNPPPGTRITRGATILVEAAGPVRR